jgi:hypothetical protein
MHKHFRMAAFINGSRSVAPFHTDEVELMGDKTGIAAGIIATQLWHKFALSATISHTQLLDKSRFKDVIYVPVRLYKAINYDVSAGYLLFPREYKSYKQLNMNLYFETLVQQSLDPSKDYIDMARAAQLIINSSSKLNLGYRFQVGFSMQLMSKRVWIISFEQTFLNVFTHKNKKATGAFKKSRPCIWRQLEDEPTVGRISLTQSEIQVKYA